jgi:hypothetical protein
MSLRSRLERLERVEAEAPTDGMPKHFWSWVGREPLDAATARECEQWARDHVPRVPIPSCTGNMEQKIQAILNARQAAERPRLPAGLVELPNGDRHGPT